jgi:glutathione S-transferase
MAKELNYNRDLLKKVLARFKNNKNDCKYICTEAIGIADARDSANLRRYIRYLLGGIESCEEWLAYKAKVPKRSLTKEAMREYRIRWMEHMLKNDPFFASQKAD